MNRLQFGPLALMESGRDGSTIKVADFAKYPHLGQPLPDVSQSAYPNAVQQLLNKFKSHGLTSHGLKGSQVSPEGQVGKSGPDAKKDADADGRSQDVGPASGPEIVEANSGTCGKVGMSGNTDGNGNTDTSSVRSSQGVMVRSGTAFHSQRVFIPTGYEPNYAYPLIVYLHDQGQDSAGLQKIMPEISFRNYIGVAYNSPQFRHAAVVGRAQRSKQRTGEGTTPGGGAGRGVGAKDARMAAGDSTASWMQESDVIAASMEALSSCLRRTQRRLNINLDKIFLVGVGAGGTMALRLALMLPDRVAGAVSLNGELPQGGVGSQGSLFGRLKQARAVPLFLAHYRESTRFPEYQLCENLKLFHAGGFSVTMRQYPCDDRGCKQVFSDVDRWVMEQVTGMPST